MSSPESISSTSSSSPSGLQPTQSASHPLPQPPHRLPAHANHASTSSSSWSQRPLPNLPHQPDSHSASVMNPAALRDRPLPNPSDQTLEERRRSIVALDRKRRLTNPIHDGPKRRSNDPYTHGPSVQSRADDTFPSGGRPVPEVIDLTGSSPPASPGNGLARTSSQGSRQYTVPRWQPDSEAHECFICNRPFSFMFRRHHCRKCGRVVCNECSPHRITIPRAFIVQPPRLDLAHSPPLDLPQIRSDEVRPRALSSPQHHQLGSCLDGGEKVRLCNPCVPDPQPSPASNYYSTSGLSNSANIGGSHAGHSAPSTYPTGHRQTMSLSSVPRPSGSTVRRDYTGFETWLTCFQDFHASMPTQEPPPLLAPLTTCPPSRYGNTGSHESTFPWFGFSTATSSPSRHRWTVAQPTGPARRPGDLDTVGQTALPDNLQDALSLPGMPRSLDSRMARPEHAGASHSAPHRARGPSLMGDSRPMATRASQNPFVTSPRIRLAEEDICPICRRALPPRGPNGDESAREAHIVDCIRARDPGYQGEGGTGGGSSGTRVHMLPFTATEKDCVGEDGTPQECSICMVEYDVGDELARLECLCKFHKDCIVEWMSHKAECPLHKLLM